MAGLSRRSERAVLADAPRGVGGEVVPAFDGSTRFLGGRDEETSSAPPAHEADPCVRLPGSAFRDGGGEQVAQLVADHRSGRDGRHPPRRRIAIGERRVHLDAEIGVQLPRQQQPAQVGQESYGQRRSGSHGDRRSGLHGGGSGRGGRGCTVRNGSAQRTRQGASRRPWRPFASARPRAAPPRSRVS